MIVKIKSGRLFIDRVLRWCNLLLTIPMIWKTMMIATECQFPIILLRQGGMHPVFERGDVLFMTNFNEEPINIGDIVAFHVPKRGIFLIHRVMKLKQRQNGTVTFVTKGDTNIVNDQGVYPSQQKWLTRNDITGKVKVVVPYLGMIFIIIQQYPKIQGALLLYVILFDL